MPLNYSAAYSSRVTKRPIKPPSLRRSASSPFASFNQRKPVQRSKTKPETEQQEDFFGEKLDDLGLVTTLSTDVVLPDVAQIVRYANRNMFDSLPESGGFNSTRISEILNFRKSLPITVTVGHVHALSISPTATEREISELMKANILRKLVVPGRGVGGSTVGEGLVLINDLKEMLERSDAIEDHLKPAVGGEGAVVEAGGTLGLRRETSHGINTSPLQLALPNMGPYLRLITQARTHLVSLLHRSRFREMPLYLLHERWDGGISNDDPAAQAKKYRGEFAGVLPARTRKWRQFWGLRFEFVLAECVGSGLIELFETGSVGKAVRAL
ncbi:MAG: hypothetical protein Q9193_004903 [Seirophora villosa]